MRTSPRGSRAPSEGRRASSNRSPSRFHSFGPPVHPTIWSFSIQYSVSASRPPPRSATSVSMPPLKGAFSSPGGEGHGTGMPSGDPSPRGSAAAGALARSPRRTRRPAGGRGIPRRARPCPPAPFRRGRGAGPSRRPRRAWRTPVVVHEPRGDPRALVGDRGEALAVGQDPKRRDAAEARVVRDEVQAAAVLQAAHHVLPRVLGVERDARRAHGHGIGGDEGGQGDRGRQETREESTVQHDGRGG